MGDYLNEKQIGIHIKLDFNGKVSQNNYLLSTNNLLIIKINKKNVLN